MGKKKNKQNIWIRENWGFLLIMVAVIVLTIFTFWDMDKLEFTITKQNCWNETHEVLVRELLEEGTEFMSYGIRFNPKEKITTWNLEEELIVRGLESSLKKEYGYVSFIEFINATSYDYNSGLHQKFFGLLNQDGYPLHELSEFQKEYDLMEINNPSEYWVDAIFNFSVFYRINNISFMNETMEFCESIEVDEMEGMMELGGYPAGWHVQCMGTTSEESLNIINEELKKYGRVCEDNLVKGMGVISKEELNIEWLGENAECNGYYPYDDYPLYKTIIYKMLNKTEEIKKELCGKYKYENYIIYNGKE